MSLLLVAVFIVKVFFIPVKTPLIAIAVTDYPAPYPPNAWAREDLDRFERVWPSVVKGISRIGPGEDSNLNVTEIAEAWQTETNALGTLHQALKELRPGGPKKDVVLLYISAHGVLDAQGEPCLLLGGLLHDEPGVAPDAPLAQHTLKVSKLLAQFRDSVADEKTNKVLILDANRIDANWRLGILYNGFAERLEQTVRDAKIDNLFVLNSTGPGEVGRCSPKLQASHFARFLTEGLQHGSDRDGDERISLLELLEFVQGKVATQTMQEWHASQRPILIPAEASEAAGLVYVARPQQASPVGEDLAAAWDAAVDRDALADLWAEHAKLRPWHDLGQPAAASLDTTADLTTNYRQRETRRQLASWEAFQQGLLRYEQVLQAGKAYRDESLRLKSLLDAMVTDLKSPRNADGSVAYSLPLAAMFGQAPTPADVAKAEQLLSAPPAPETPADAQPEATPAVAAAARAVAAWQWALAGAHTERLTQALELLDGGDQAAGPDLIELHFLRLVSPGMNLLPTTMRNDAALIQAALDCRRVAEQAAVAAGDERVQYFIRPAVTNADQLRRRAEDQLFVGSPSDRALANRDFKRAYDLYMAAAERARTLARAFDTRDRGASHLPYLATWLARRPGAALEPGPREGQLQQLENAIAHLDQLTDRLETISKSPDTGDVGALPDENLTQLIDRTRDDITRLEIVFNQAVGTAGQSASDGENLREIDELLASPLATGELRGRLLSIYFELLNRSSAARATAATQTTPVGAAVSTPLYWRWHARPHPAIQILGLERDRSAESSPDSSADQNLQPVAAPTQQDLLRTAAQLAAQGNQIRQQLAQVPAQIQELQRSRTSDGPVQLSTIRPGRANAVRVARTSLPFLSLTCDYGAPERFLGEAFGRLERLDRQQLMIWHGERTLDDFWGPSNPTDPENTYFMAVSGQYLKAARQLEPDVGPILNPLVQLREARAQAAIQPLAITINGSPRIDAVGEVEAQVAILPSAEAPAGVAAVYVLDPTDQPAPVAIDASGEPCERFEVVVANHGQAASQGVTGEERRLRLSEVAAEAGDLQLVGLYRAHRVEFPLAMPLPPDVTREIAWEPVKVGPPRLIVEGQDGDPGAIAFVLDCSASMRKRGEPNRMDPARNALMKILTDLASQSKKYRVSLWLYGHRCNNGATGERLWNDQWEKVPGLLPCDDVQQVIRPVDLDQTSLKAFSSLLYAKDSARYDKVRAFGLTPLHLAMIRVVRDELSNPDQINATAPRRMVVITDGNNNVEPNPGAKWTPTKRWTEQEVRQALTESQRGYQYPVQVDMIACDVPDMAALEALLQEPVNGRVLPVRNVNLLTANLKQALGLYNVEIQPAGGDPQPIVVDEEQRLPMPRGREKYTALLPELPNAGQAQFAVEGGERLVLRLIQDDRRYLLVHRRYDFQGEVYKFPAVEGRPQASPPDRDFDPEKFAVSVRRPYRAGEDVPFEISIQNGDSTRFSPRPVERWIEITPRNSNATGSEATSEPYIFYDPNYLPGQSAPVLKCLASKWPASADQADIWLFFKMHATGATRGLRIGEVKRLGEQPDDQLALRLKSGETVRFAVDVTPAPSQADAWNVVVKEIHEPEDHNLGSVKVALSPAASRSSRRYFAALGQVEHTFVVEGVSRAELNNFDLYITSRDELMANAAIAAEPLTVTVSAGGR